MVTGFNPYFLGVAAMLVVAGLFVLTRQWLWALAFGGGALVLYFLGMGRDLNDDGDNDARR